MGEFKPAIPQIKKDNNVEIIPHLTLQELFDKVIHQKKEGVKITLHPNGFLQLPLESTDKRNSNLQLHIWNNTLERRGAKQFEIHDHAFDIESYVVMGSLKDITYSVSENPSGEYMTFQSDGSGQMNSVNKKVSLNIKNDRTIKEGETYIIKKGDFHSSNPIDPFTATIIKKTNIEIDYNPKLIAPTDYNQTRIEVDRNIEQETAWKLVDEVLNNIKKKFNIKE